MTTSQTTPKLDAASAANLRPQARRAIETINEHWGNGQPLPGDTLQWLTRVVTVAAASGDRASADWLMLLQWEPKERAN